MRLTRGAARKRIPAKSRRYGPIPSDIVPPAGKEDDTRLDDGGELNTLPSLTTKPNAKMKSHTASIPEAYASALFASATMPSTIVNGQSKNIRPAKTGTKYVELAPR